MAIKDIYTFSDISNINEFAHFLFGVLIPLLYYDIQTKHSHTFNIKINVFKFERILKEIFNKRIQFNYININYNSSQIDKNYYWDLYINLLKNKDENNKNNIILLPTFDSLFSHSYHYINKNIIPNQNTLKKYETQYTDFYSGNHNSLTKSQFNEIKEKYKLLHYTDLYFKFIMYKKSIDRFLHNIYPSQKHNYKVILIDRQYQPFIQDDMLLNTGGQRRIIYNHTELKNTISKLYQGDFINIQLEKINFEDQYYLFKNAKIIIGQHGAGLFNIFFSKPNFKTHLVEIAPKNIWSVKNKNNLKNLAEFCEINYHCVKQPSMTIVEWEHFSLIHNIKQKITLDDLEKFNFADFEKDKLYVIKSFIHNSGSVNINEILTILKSINC